jgi:hypothetical protein
MKSPIQFRISELRQRSMLRTTEAIMVIFAAIIAIAVLPTLLLRYLYDPTQLLEQPKLLEYIPVVSIVIATFYFLRSLMGNMKREKEIGSLMMELEMMEDDCCGSGKCGTDEDLNDEDWDEDLKELEELLAEVEAEEATEAKKSTKKKSTKKKSTKKSSKK